MFRTTFLITLVLINQGPVSAQDLQPESNSFPVGTCENGVPGSPFGDKCCPSTHSSFPGQCPSSSCTVSFNFPNDRNSLCNTNLCPNTVCVFASEECLTQKPLPSCWGTVECELGSTCEGRGENCLVTGANQPGNYKICARDCVSDAPLQCSPATCGQTLQWMTCGNFTSGLPQFTSSLTCPPCNSCLDFAPERCAPATPDNSEVKTFPPRPAGDCNELVTAFSLKHPIVMFVSESNEIGATLTTVENLLSQWLIASPAHSIVIYASTLALRNSMWEAIKLSANIPADWTDDCGMISVERAVPDPSPCDGLDQDINQRKAMFWMRGVLKNRRVWQSVEFARVDPGFELSSSVTAATDPFVSLLAPKLYAFLTEATGCTPQMLNCTSNLVNTPDIEVLCGQYTPQNGRWFELFSTGLLRRKESQAAVDSFINSRALANFGYAEMRFLHMAILLKSPAPADGTVSLCPALPTADCP